jgi:uncharacterized protein (TIGR02246 family)
MRRLLLAAFASVLIFANQAAKASDESDIRKRSEDIAAAWNRHDAKAMAGYFAPNGDLLNPYGRMARGRAEIEKLYKDEHSTINRKSTMKLTGAPAVRMLAPGLAFVDIDAEISNILNPDGTAMPVQKTHISRVLQKSGGQWWIIASRAMRSAPRPGGK